MAEVNVKKIRERVVKMDDAWDEGAPGVNFGGIKETDFKADITAAATLEQELDDMLALVDMKRTAIDDAYAALQEKSVLVVNGVKGDPAYGEDSALYGAMGFVRKSERASGLTRKRKTPQT